MYMSKDINVLLFRYLQKPKTKSYGGFILSYMIRALFLNEIMKIKVT